MISTLDLFSGIGGFALGLDRAGGYEVSAFCEVDDKCVNVLKYQFPNVPIHRDVKKLKGSEVGKVDLVCGGFPCQAFSSAARGRNNAEDLWPEMERLVSEIRPSYAIAENVKFDPIARAADHFCGLGMSCDVICISGYDLGADHERKRWWAIAHPYKNGEFQRAFNAEASKLSFIRSGLWEAENFRAAIRLHDGIPRRMDYARLYGNAVIPLAVELIGRSLKEALDA